MSAVLKCQQAAFQWLCMKPNLIILLVGLPLVIWEAAVKLYTSVGKVMRPTIINAGFNVDGVDQVLPQMVGLNEKPMRVNMRSKAAQLAGYDFVSFLRNSLPDHQIMATAQRSDQIISSVLTDLGFTNSSV